MSDKLLVYIADVRRRAEPEANLHGLQRRTKILNHDVPLMLLLLQKTIETIRIVDRCEPGREKAYAEAAIAQLEFLLDSARPLP